MPIQAIPAEKCFYLKKMYRFDREKTQKPTETFEPQSKCIELSEKGDFGVMLFVRVDASHTHVYSGSSS